jgi:probable DNA repair protein
MLMEFIEQTTHGLQELFEQLRSGATVLTVNNRLAKRLNSDFNQYMASEGHQVWQTPDLLPLSAWLHIQIEKLGDAGLHQTRFLTSHQELRLWTDIIKPDAWQLYMMQPSAIARPVQQAWQLVKQWQIRWENIAEFDAPETRALLRWGKQFEELCSKNDWLSQTLVIEFVTHAISKQHCKPNDHIIFAGFDDPHQLHKNLAQSLTEQQCHLSYFRHEAINQKQSLRVCNDFQDELQQAANWARQLVLKDATKKIAVVIPSLNENRSKVDQCFRKTLHPERVTPPPYTGAQLYNLSLGIPLAQYPLVDNALTCLALLSEPIPLQTLSTVLLAPFLSAGSSSSKIDLLLRHHGRKQWTLKALIHFLKQTLPEETSGSSHLLPQKLDQLLLLKQQIKTSNTADEYGQLFLEIWKTFGWPGSRSLDSHEYQQSERLLKLLAEFRQLHLVKQQLSFAEACSILGQMCHETIFQEQTDDAPVLVSGLLEAAEQQFDYLWLSGLDDETLPARSAPNPFIPVALQKQFNLPHCSAEREYAFSEKLFRHFIQHARHIVFSYPSREADRELRASSFLNIPDLPVIHERSADKATQAEAVIELEYYSDAQLPPLPRHQLVKGGTAVLSQQAVCPFQAAASFRLHASEPDQAVDGASALDKGSQVHQVLELIWQQLNTSHSLLKLDDTLLQQTVENAINKVMSYYQHKRPDLYQDNFLSLEKQRLLKLILNWLDIDKQRLQAFTVVEIEEDKTLEIGDLVFKARIDRIDELANGQRILLDYKTGLSATSNSWLNEQITEPQLPLYSLTEPTELAALALAKVNERQCGFSGLAISEDVLPGVKPPPDEADWSMLKQLWNERLTQLAESYRNGDAYIEPGNCLYCSFASLCRKDSLRETVT